MTVVTFLCGPWGSWVRFNLHKGGAASTVERAREATRPLLRLSDEIIDARIRRGRHVLVEQPAGSIVFDLPEMARARAHLESGKLMEAWPHGCFPDYVDAESGLAHKKPMRFLTTSVALLWDALSSGCRRCDGRHRHQELAGSNAQSCRTTQAAEWPDGLDGLALKT